MEICSDNLKIGGGWENKKTRETLTGILIWYHKQRHNPHSPICDILLIFPKRNKSQEMQVRETGYLHLSKKKFAIAFVYILYISSRFEDIKKDSIFSWACCPGIGRKKLPTPQVIQNMELFVVTYSLELHVKHSLL